MIRSVVEIVAAICINSIGVALAAVGIETVEYGSSLQFLFVILPPLFWALWRYGQLCASSTMSIHTGWADLLAGFVIAPGSMTEAAAYLL